MLHPKDEVAAEAWRGQWCSHLKHEGGQAALEGLRGLEVRGAVASECLKEVITYFTSQAGWMDDPAYRAKGWCLGSALAQLGLSRGVGVNCCITYSTMEHLDHLPQRPIEYRPGPEPWILR